MPISWLAIGYGRPANTTGLSALRLHIGGPLAKTFPSTLVWHVIGLISWPQIFGLTCNDDLAAVYISRWRVSGRTPYRKYLAIHEMHATFAFSDFRSVSYRKAAASHYGVESGWWVCPACLVVQ